MPQWNATLHTAAGRPILAQLGRHGESLPTSAGELTLLAWASLAGSEESLTPLTQTLAPNRIDLIFTHPGPEETVRRLLSALQRESAAQYHTLSASTYRSVLWKRRCTLTQLD